MKISKLRTQWIIFVSSLQTLNTCGQSILMQALGKTTRAWVDSSLQLLCKRLLKQVKVTWTVINPHQVEPKQGRPTIIMCNHSSAYDIPLSYQVFPKHSIRMLAKKELSRIPVVGKGMLAAEFPFIDRKHLNQSIKDLEKVNELLKSGIVMWIFPEGTRSKDGKLAPFKKGAFITAIETRATIIPVGIRGATNILPARTLQLHLNQTAEIHVGEPIDASSYDIGSRSELVEKVHQSIEKLLEEPK